MLFRGPFGASMVCGDAVFEDCATSSSRPAPRRSSNEFAVGALGSNLRRLIRYATSNLLHSSRRYFDLEATSSCSDRVRPSIVASILESWILFLVKRGNLSRISKT